MLNHAVERGEITPAYAAVAVDLVYGSLWYRLIFRVGTLDYRWADEVAAAIARGLLQRSTGHQPAISRRRG